MRSWGMFVVVVVVAGCASTPEARAVQQTAIGGGFVAMGTVSTVSTAVGTVGVVAVANGNRTVLTAAAPYLIAGAAYSAVLLGTGIGMIAFAAPDLERLTGKQAAPTTSRPAARPALRIESPPLDETLSQPQPPKPALQRVSDRLSSGTITADTVVVAIDGCEDEVATLIVDGVNFRGREAPGGSELPRAATASSTFVSLFACGETLELEPAERGLFVPPTVPPGTPPATSTAP